jgi:UDP-glucose 4-epimerase
MFRKYPIDSVMHLAAESEVEASMTNPQRYYHANVVAGLNLLGAMLKYGIHKMVFSSTAAIYGEPKTPRVDEDHPEKPVNVYGDTKLTFEKILGWYRKAYGLDFICLRYFNAAGASAEHGEDHHPETHLIPRIIQAALKQDSQINIYGRDYPTRDGSCIRDYVHVTDIARAHILALDKLEILSGRAFNLGNGEGYTVIEVVEAVRKASGIALNVKMCPRRQGDPATLVASSKLARELLGWQPQYSSLEDIVDSSWHWARKHPQGYASLTPAHTL